jgi:hypothetical protein
MVMVALIVSSMFNAMLRDWRFGVPIMLLIAIAYRESRSISPQLDFDQIASVSAGTNEPSELVK